MGARASQTPSIDGRIVTRVKSAIRRIAVILAFSCIYATCVCAKATATGQPTLILFVGNSFVHGGFEPVRSYGTDGVTDENYGLTNDDPRYHAGPPWGGVAAIFKTFTREAGLAYDVHVELVSGAPLRFHYEHALGIVAQPKWDIVVLQELSTGPVLRVNGTAPADFPHYTDLFERAIHRVAPAAQIVLYETFPRADLTYPAGAPYRGKGIETMARALHDAYFRVAQHEGIASVAPVGDAWLRAIREGAAEANPYRPEARRIDLWAADNYHPSAWGAYLAACVFFERITGHDIRRLGAEERAAAALGIAPVQTRTLQRIAHETAGTSS